MKHFIFIFKDCALFEVTLLANFLVSQGEEVMIVGEEAMVKVHEGFNIKTDMLISDINLKDVQSFTVTGGNPANLKDAETLKQILTQLKENPNILIGAICGGVYIISNLLNVPISKVNHPDVVRYENILVSPPNKYVDFAINMLRELKLFKDEDDYKETVTFFKEFKAE